MYEIRVNQCLIESRVLTSSRTPAATRSRETTTLDAVNQAGVRRVRRLCATATLTPTPTRQAPSFNYTQLRTLDASKKHAESTFKVGQPFWIQVFWTMENLHGTAHLKVTVQWQISVHGKWEKDPKLLPGVSSASAVNGKNSTAIRYYCPSGSSEFRLSVSLTYSKKTQTRTAVIHVTSH
jgi:hypothetical protein